MVLCSYTRIVPTAGSHSRMYAKAIRMKFWMLQRYYSVSVLDIRISLIGTSSVERNSTGREWPHNSIIRGGLLLHLKGTIKTKRKFGVWKILLCPDKNNTNFTPNFKHIIGKLKKTCESVANPPATLRRFLYDVEGNFFRDWRCLTHPQDTWVDDCTGASSSIWSYHLNASAYLKHKWMLLMLTHIESLLPILCHRRAKFEGFTMFSAFFWLRGDTGLN